MCTTREIAEVGAGGKVVAEVEPHKIGGVVVHVDTVIVDAS